MGRLTWKKPDGTWGLVNGDIKKVPREYYGHMCKLKDYEETGLDPERIEEVNELYLAKCKEVNELQEKLAEGGGWIPTERELPPHSDNLLLVQCNGKPRKNITLENAFELASYTEEGWVFQMYPVWDDAEVVAWRNLPVAYQKGE